MNNTVATLKKRNTAFTWLILLTAAFFFIPSFAMPYVWYDLAKVHINENNTAGEYISMDIERTIHRKFRGVFSVTIYTENGEYVCQRMPTDPIVMDPSLQVPNPLYLRRWLGGGQKVEDCLDQGMDEGTFYADTCVTVVMGPISIPLANRCTKSNLFSVTTERKNDV